MTVIIKKLLKRGKIVLIRLDLCRSHAVCHESAFIGSYKSVKGIGSSSKYRTRS